MSPAKHGKHWRFIPLLSTEQNTVSNTGTFGFLTYSISLNHHWYHTKCTHTCKKQEKISNIMNIGSVKANKRQ